MEEAHKQAISQLTESHKQTSGKIDQSLSQVEASNVKLEQSLSKVEASNAQLQGSNGKLEQSLSKVEASNVKLEQSKQTLGKLMQTDKRRGAYFCAGASSGKDGSGYMKWNSARVPVNKEFFSLSDDSTEVTIKEKGVYRFHADVMTNGTINNQHVYLKINGTDRRGAGVCCPISNDQCILSAILEINANDKAKVYCSFTPHSGVEHWHTFTIQHI